MNIVMDYEVLKKQGTGSHDSLEERNIVEYRFGRYRIKILLTPTNEFVGIEEVAIDKDFVAHRKKITPLGYHDVAEFYPEE